MAKHRKPSRQQKGYTNKWIRYSQRYRDANPLCRHCELRGRPVPAQCVDHIIPHKGDYDRFWSTYNHQPLCKTCHDHKSSREARGMVAWWLPSADAVVMYGSSSEAKAEAAKHIMEHASDAAWWNEDNEAAKRGYMQPNMPTVQQIALDRERRRFIERNESRSVVVLCTDARQAFTIAQELQGELLFCW